MQEIERYRLEFPPGMTRITKLGRIYNFSRTYQDETPPETHTGLSKAAAYQMLACTLKTEVIGE